MYDDDNLVLVQDPVTGDYIPLALPQHAETRIEITCPRCGSEYVGSIFKAAREGYPDHKCRKPRGKVLRIL